MSPGARKAAPARKTKPAAKTRRSPGRPTSKPSAELSRVAEQNISRAEALAALYRPLQEAAEADLKKTRSGRELLEAAHQFSASLDELHEGIRSERTSAEEGDLLLRGRQEEFFERHGEQFVEARARHADLQPSVEAVTQILRPEMAAQTMWVAETSPFRSMLLQPKLAPEDVGTVSQGLGDPRRPPPPIYAWPTYEHKDEHFLLPPFINDYPWGTEIIDARGQTNASGRCMTTSVLVHVEAALASAFVGADFPVPKGPTFYTATITYDWECSGMGCAALGVAIVNVDLAIVIDNLDGTRETHAREVSLLTVPVFGLDSFRHGSNNVIIEIPFRRSGLNGTTRIWVGVDGHGTAVGLGSYADFYGSAVVREIRVTQIG